MAEITYNLKIQFPQEEQDYWKSLLEMERDAYNICSKIVFEKKLPMSLKIVHDESYYIIRKAIPDLPSQTVNNVIREVIGSYRAIKKNGHHIDEPAEKKNLSLRLDARLCSNFDKTGINLISSTPYKRKRVEFKLYDEIKKYFDKYTLSSPLIFYRNGQFFISCTFNVPDKPISNNQVLGIDLGERMLYVDSDGNALKGNEFLKYKRKYRYLKRQLQKKKKSHSARTKRRKISRRERNFSKNYIHHVVNNILKTEKDTIILEDLSKIKENTKNIKLENGKEIKNKKHNNRISQIPFYMTKMILSYKAPLVGKQVVTVNPVFTSKTDSQTGRKSGLRKGRRFYAKNGKVYDADWNAAINIAKRHGSRKHPTSWKVPLDGRLHLVGRLLSTNQSSDGGSIPLSWQAKVIHDRA